jgi:hypothetical protein
MRVHRSTGIALGLFFSVTIAAQAQGGAQHPSFEILTHRMDVDVDGAPNAYGRKASRRSTSFWMHII